MNLFSKLFGSHVSGSHPNPALNDELIDAAKRGDISAVRKLIAKGANPNAVNNSSITPLLAACYYGHHLVVAELVSKNADVNFKNEDDHTPLHFAVMEKQVQVLEILLKHGANPEVFESDGLTPLMGAANNGDVASVRMLLQHGADVNTQSGTGSKLMTALLAGQGRGFTELEKVLREAGAKEIRFVLRENA